MKIAITDGLTIFNIINLESDTAINSLPEAYKALPYSLYHLTSEEISNNYVIVNNEFLQVTAKPSKNHKYNLTTNSWEIPEEYRQSFLGIKIEDINTARTNLSLQPIQYDGKSLDADTQAQANINGKLQEIFARESANTPLASGEMFWKDADNVVHSWTNQNDYKLWLQGLVIAISSRNTSLYATAWSKKAEVEALTDINDIINYDENTGW